MNKTLLIGRLTKDPAVTAAEGKTTIARMTVAVDRQTKEKGADFIPVVAFGKTAELCGKYLTKGRQVAVEGHIVTGSYEKDGVKHYTTDVHADRVEFIGSGNGGNSGNGDPAPAGDAPSGFTALTDDEIPF